MAIGRPWQTKLPGITLTSERYLAVEQAYIDAAVAFLTESGTASLRAVTVEDGENKAAPVEGSSVPLAEVPEVLRSLLHNAYWCRLESDAAFVHGGYGYYVYVGVPQECPKDCALARSLGPFPEVFRSPYLERAGPS